MIEGVLLEGLVYAIMALGVFVTFRILDFPDLTVEGSFPFGAVTGGVLLAAGSPPALALAVAFLAGALAGSATALIHQGLRVPTLLAGIVVTTGLYSVGLRVLGGRANLPLIQRNPVMEAAQAWLGIDPVWSAVIGFGLGVLLLVGLLDLFFHTELGIALGALGDNEKAVIQAGANPAILRGLGVAGANGLAGLSGALAASYQGFADVNSGLGVVAAGLASVMLGELLFRTNRIGAQLLRVVLGSLLFRLVMYAGRSWGYLAGVTPNDLRLLTALLIVGAIALSRTRQAARERRPYRRRGERVSPPGPAAAAAREGTPEEGGRP